MGTAEGLRLLMGRVGEGVRGEVSGAGCGVGVRKNVNGFRDLSGGWRRLRYILKFRSARLAWGTYLERGMSV